MVDRLSERAKQKERIEKLTGKKYSLKFQTQSSDFLYVDAIKSKIQLLRRLKKSGS